MKLNRRMIFWLLVSLSLSLPPVMAAAGPLFQWPAGVKRQEFHLRAETGETFEETVTEVKRNGGICYEIISRGSKGRQLKIVLAPDLTTISVQCAESGGEIVRAADYGPDKIHLVIPAKRIDRWLNKEGPVYDQQSLFYVLQGFPFGKVEAVQFTLMTTEGLLIKANLTNRGVSHMTVDKKQAVAYRLELTPAGLYSLLYSGSFYYGLDSPHLFLRYQDGAGHCVEAFRSPQVD